MRGRQKFHTSSTTLNFFQTFLSMLQGTKIIGTHTCFGSNPCCVALRLVAIHLQEKELGHRNFQCPQEKAHGQRNVQFHYLRKIDQQYKYSH